MPISSNILSAAAQVGDEEHNPFAGYEDLGRAQEKEMEVKQVKRMTAKQAQYVCQRGSPLAQTRWLMWVSCRIKKSICGR